MQSRRTQKEFVKILKQNNYMNIITYMFKWIHYCYLIYQRIFELDELDELVPPRFITAPGSA